MSNITASVKAQSLLAQTVYSTDLTQMRSDGRRIAFIELRGGDWTFRGPDGRYWLVDLVTETCRMLVGVIPAPAA